MARTLNAYVYVNGVGYAPGDAVPDDVAKKIGAHAWTDGEPDVQAAGTRGVGDPVPETPVQLGGDDAAKDHFPASDDAVEPGTGDAPAAPSGDLPSAPPRSGRGSGLEAWKAHAEKLGIQVSDSADRDDVMAAVDAYHLSHRETQQ